MTNHTPATTETLSPTRRQCTVQHSCPHAPAEANPAQTPAVVLLHARSAATGPATHRVRLSSLAWIADTPPPPSPRTLTQRHRQRKNTHGAHRTAKNKNANSTHRPPPPPLSTTTTYRSRRHRTHVRPLLMHKRKARRHKVLFLGPIRVHLHHPRPQLRHRRRVPRQDAHHAARSGDQHHVLFAHTFATVVAAAAPAAARAIQAKSQQGRTRWGEVHHTEPIVSTTTQRDRASEQRPPPTRNCQCPPPRRSSTTANATTPAVCRHHCHLQPKLSQPLCCNTRAAPRRMAACSGATPILAPTLCPFAYGPSTHYATNARTQSRQPPESTRPGGQRSPVKRTTAASFWMAPPGSKKLKCSLSAATAASAKCRRCAAAAGPAADRAAAEARIATWRSMTKNVANDDEEKKHGGGRVAPGHGVGLVGCSGGTIAEQREAGGGCGRRDVRDC